MKTWDQLTAECRRLIKERDNLLSRSQGEPTPAVQGRLEAIYGAILNLLQEPVDRPRNEPCSVTFYARVHQPPEPAGQPYVESVTVAGSDRVYVGYNHMLQICDPGTTATVLQSLDANPAPPAAVVFRAETIEGRDTAGADGPPIRTALHPDGTVYAACYRATAFEQLGTMLGDALYTSDIVVVRDDNGATGPDPYRDLAERLPPRGDGMPGVRVVRQIRVPFVNEHVFGQERVGPRLSLAVDPRSSATVYVAWADGDWHPDSERLSQRIHLRRSQNRGGSWSDDLRTIENAINPAVAVNSLGRVGFLYQQLVDRDSGDPRWVIHLEIMRHPEGLRHRRDIVLADVPADSPSARTSRRVHLPFLGDYLDLLTVGSTFYGAFAAYNKPDYAHFPQGVTYLRQADFGVRQLLDGAGEPVAESIDPFFFQVTNNLSVDICAVRPWLCDFAPLMEPSRLTLQCRARDCLVVDFIDKNCQVKYGGRPGCEAGSLCPHTVICYLMVWATTGPRFWSMKISGPWCISNIGPIPVW